MCTLDMIASTLKVLHLSKVYSIESPICSATFTKQYTNQNINDTKHFQIFNHSRYYVTQSSLPKEDGIFKKLWKKQFNRSKFKLEGYLHYENIVDVIDYNKWFKECNLQDCFMSWFLITELHVWLLMVRCMAEGEDGRNLRNDIVESFWNDVSFRCKKIGPISASQKNEDLELLSQQFQAAIAGYDEGLLTNDMVLAGAIWRRFYQLSCDDASSIEKIIEYIRKQTIVLDKIPKDKFFSSKERNVFWTTLPSRK